MKRLISIILIVILMTSCFAFPIAASTGVIEKGLQSIIDSKPNEIVRVEIYYKGHFKSIDEFPSWPDRLAAAKEHNAYADQIQAEYQSVIFEGIETANINYYNNSWMVDVDVKAGDIPKIAESGLVKNIYHIDLENVICEPEDVLYKDKFDAVYPAKIYSNYEELYYHKDNSGEIDWALIKLTPAEEYQVMDAMIEEIVGSRVVIEGGREAPFANRYGIYNVKEDKFESLVGDMPGTVADYEGLGKAYDEYGTGRLLGDIDRDNELTIIDCTLMQRCATRVRDWPDDDAIKTEIYSAPKLKYYSDFDRDGERDIVDATKLQRYMTMID